MVDGLVARTARDGTHQCIHRVVTEWDAVVFVGAAEIAINRFAYERREAFSAPRRLITQFPVGFLGKAEVRRFISHHRDIMISARAVSSEIPGVTRRPFHHEKRGPSQAARYGGEDGIRTRDRAINPMAV